MPSGHSWPGTIRVPSESHRYVPAPGPPKTRAPIIGHSRRGAREFARLTDFGDAVVDRYLHAGEWEPAEYDRHLTDWELTRYFERACGESAPRRPLAPGIWCRDTST